MCVRKNETNKDQVLKLKEFSHGDTSIILIENLLKTLEEYGWRYPLEYWHLN